jgi:nitrate reductase alpha subunit
VCVGHLGNETDVVLQPLQHDSPAELSQPFDIQDWRKGECDLIPGKTAPNIAVVERNYPETYERFTSLGPLMDKLGNGGKGISWNTQNEVDFSASSITSSPTARQKVVRGLKPPLTLQR